MTHAPPEINVARWLTGFVFVPVLLLALFLDASVVGVALDLVFYGLTGPFEKPALAIMSVGILGLLAAFFSMVARRLLAALRGRPVPHLFPPAVGFVVGGVVGLLFLGMGVAWFLGAKVGRGAVQGIPMGSMFLAYAAQSFRTMMRARTSVGVAKM